jgi:chromosome segregation ATPase
MTDLRSQLKARTDKLNSMMEAAAQSAAHIDDLKQQLEAARDDLQELEELRDLKKDIERKEKQQAAIIEGQVRGLLRRHS